VDREVKCCCTKCDKIWKESCAEYLEKSQDNKPPKDIIFTECYECWLAEEPHAPSYAMEQPEL